MPTIYWEKLIRLDYWFEGIGGRVSITPPVEYGSWFFWFFISFFTAVFSIGVLIRVSQGFLHKNYPLQPKLNFWGNSVIWIGFWGLTWFLVRQLSVGFLGARFWLLVLGIWFLVILYLALRYLFSKYKFEKSYFDKYKTLPPGVGGLG
jgi:hypothetical protein